MSTPTATPQRPAVRAPKDEILGRYTDPQDGQRREVISVTQADGARLVIDRLAASEADARLVGEIARDEPHENARILCEVYLADEQRGICRALTPDDLSSAAKQAGRVPEQPRRVLEPAGLTDSMGRRYMIREVPWKRSLANLRWTRHAEGLVKPVTLRDVIAAMQDYEPARTITETTLAYYEGTESARLSVLRGELSRVLEGQLVLNRRLREVVQLRVNRGELSMSEIATRCERTKRRGGGETSWLARRIGLVPDSGASEPTPWVHPDVLALIARDGLGVCPCEVEV
jgi:hypothetical protein